MSETDIITPQQAESLYGLLLERIKRSPNTLAYQSYCTTSAEWQRHTWKTVGEQLSFWQQALANEQLKHGDRVALNLRNCVEWILFDQAAHSLGLVIVPLYPDDRPDNVAYILDDADVKFVLLNSDKQWPAILDALPETHSIKKVVALNDIDVDKDSFCIGLSDWLIKQPATLLANTAAPEKLASIVYTSGTTGRPKGVMLSHLNMLSVAHGASVYLDVFPSDRFLSFLPLSHTLERTAGYYLPMMAGASVAFARSILQLADDMQQIKPTVLIAVPRIFERIYDRLHRQLADKSFFARFVFNSAVNIGWQRFLYQQKRRRWSPSFLLWPIFNKRIVAPFHQRLGGELRVAVSGGAALPSYAAKLFIGLDLCLLQGYGLTETSPVISVNRPENNIPNSVGQPIAGVTVKIGDDSELLVKTPGMMMGYWNNHKATAKMIDDDGWLHTGDQARLDESEHIYITGRIKDILVINNGEKVPPGDIETTLLKENLFDNAMIIGEGQAYLSAILVLNGDSWPKLAQSLGLDPLNKASLEDKKLQQHINNLLREALFEFPAYARIRRTILTLAPWTIENGYLTPTLKVKRPVVMNAFEADIQAIYRSDAI